MKFSLVLLLVLCTGRVMWTCAGDASRGKASSQGCGGGMTNAAVIHAVTEGDVEAVERYLRAGGRTMSEDAAVPLLGLAAWHGQQGVMRAMLRNGVDVNQASPTGWTALMLAAMGGNPESIDTLLKAGADPQARTSAGATAASIALDRKHEEAAELLQRAGQRGELGAGRLAELR